MLSIRSKPVGFQISCYVHILFFPCLRKINTNIHYVTLVSKTPVIVYTLSQCNSAHNTCSVKVHTSISKESTISNTVAIISPKAITQATIIVCAASRTYHRSRVSPFPFCPFFAQSMLSPPSPILLSCRVIHQFSRTKQLKAVKKYYNCPLAKEQIF